MFFSMHAIFCQNQTSQWYFGFNAGLNFLTNPPSPLVGSAMSVPEGCASIADDSGNLLFYTNGVNVWTATHTLMANGTGLMGDFTPTQSSIIVKKPGSTNLYYIFTVRGAGNFGGVNYSVIDMTLAGGQGSVTILNASLYNGQCAEKLAATTHCNRQDVWVVTHDLYNNQFRAFLLTAAGVSATAIVSAVGPQMNAFAGQMKISVNGSKLGYVTANDSLVSLFDFNPSSGAITNPQTLENKFNAYGCEFSGDGSKFYYTGRDSSTSLNKLKQYDLCANNAPLVVFKSAVSTTNMFGLQLALNGKIYAANGGVGSLLSVINTPNAAGLACGLQTNAQSIAPNTMFTCLPSIVASLYRFRPPINKLIGAPSACSTVSFAAPYSSTASCNSAQNLPLTFSWNFGDPASGMANGSNLVNPVHVFSSGGTYTVQLLVAFTCWTDTIKEIVTVNSVPSFTVVGPNKICKTQPVNLSVSSTVYSYVWSTQSTGNTIAVSPTTTTNYSVTAADTVTGCTRTKAIQVQVLPCLGDDENLPQELEVSIYPNPTSNNLIIASDVPNELLYLEIKDISNRAVLTSEIEINNYKALLNLDLPNGVYILIIKRTISKFEIERLIISR
jgi:hypothetical protein